MSVLFPNHETINSMMKHYFDRELKEYGDLKYAYMVLNKKNPVEVIIISNYPDKWVEIYKENNYQHIDPVVITAFKRISPFSWDENIAINSKKLSKIFSLSKEYNVINGYTFVLHDHSHYLVMLSIMIDNLTISDTEKKIENNKDKLQMLLITAHEKITSLYREIIHNDNHKNSSNKEIFSQRQKEILYWASMGKTYQEIAIILKIKTGTVKFHIGGVVKKLGVLNAKHAIRLGIELQLIKSVD
ncbi:LuxR family transcriptional regulator (plasmid) [Candidatus Fukatsuia symbiotica]|uniref:LuxR family transcriptional regulator n=1 Tax=Candidatus Fukatsuia symbiotica TaxID=1878942 RepID=A0A2Y9CKI0_9GAMM|nr:LuxR family transcriptional regulator [Candidatus Fukatsuia symbiotica]AWK15550.1 LuxR family transcriptional regulator [Candidatus Fukatsuia symbiotica]MEA9445815.1 LuxR family transcriptional regulator [Candidatus Fukatsuia symbiotica]